MFNFVTIKWRILITFLVLSSLAIYYFSDWVADSTRRHYLEAAEEVLIDQLILMKKVVLKSTPDNAGKPDFEALAVYFNTGSGRHPEAKIYEITKSATDVYFYVTDNQGTVLYHSKNPEFAGESFYIWRNVKLALEGKYGARSTRGDQSNPATSVLHISHPVIKNNKVIGTLTAVKPVKRLVLFLDISRKQVTRTAIFTLLLILLLGFLLVRRIVNPIEDLTGYTKKISRGERPPLPVLPKGELQLLGKTIEEMRKNLDGKAYIESYIQSLTHELKSPIAAIKGASELIDNKNLTDEEARLFINISNESERMSQMVQKLLLLSRLENQSFQDNVEEVELGKLVEEVLSEFKERYFERKFDFAKSNTAFIKGDPLLIKTALNNVISNACDFSKEKISVQLKIEGELIEISISDAGVGIPEFALSKVFERFYSLPRPESGTKSSGLGLSIVHEIVHLHGGSVFIRNNEMGQKGVTVSIQLLSKG